MTIYRRTGEPHVEARLQGGRILVYLVGERHYRIETRGGNVFLNDAELDDFYHAAKSLRGMAVEEVLDPHEQMREDEENNPLNPYTGRPDA